MAELLDGLCVEYSDRLWTSRWTDRCSSPWAERWTRLLALVWPLSRNLAGADRGSGSSYSQSWITPYTLRRCHTIPISLINRIYNLLRTHLIREKGPWLTSSLLPFQSKLCLIDPKWVYWTAWPYDDSIGGRLEPALPRVAITCKLPVRAHNSQKNRT